MKVALDEGVPEGLADYLPGHDVQSVRQLGLKGVKNGTHLAAMTEACFAAFITNDKKMEAEGQLRSRPFAAILLSTSLGLYAAKRQHHASAPHSGGV